MANTNKLIKKITNPNNIYNVICAIKSFINEKHLLSYEDQSLYYKLCDEFNFDEINKVINKCFKKLNVIFDKNIENFFDIEVYFKFKKFDENNAQYRPIYTASLIDQICMMSILNQIMFEIDYEKENTFTKNKTDITKILPSNFYGNMPSLDDYQIFEPWQNSYSNFTQKINDKILEYKETKKYEYKITLDLKNFFPSIQIDKLKELLLTLPDENDNKELGSVLDKLLKFNLTNFKNKDKKFEKFIEKSDEKFVAKGLPQGLPHTYFFANIVMVEIAKTINKKIPKSESFYYVDDSVTFANLSEDLNNDNINNQLGTIIKDINEEIKLYGAEVHATNGKSEICKISDIQNFEIYNKSITHLTSICSNEMFTTKSENEDKILLSKMRAINDFIKCELVKNNIKNNYRKRLVGYNKYYDLRIKILESRFKYSNLNSKTKEFFDSLNNEKFIEEKAFYGILRYYSKLMKDKDLKKFLKNIDKLYYDKIGKLNENFDYFKKFKSNILNLPKIEKTNSLELLIKDTLRIPINLSEEIKKTYIIKYFTNFKYLDLKYISKLILSKCRINKIDYIFYMLYHCDNYRIKILNAIVSEIFGFYVENKKLSGKISGRKIHLYEIIILSYIRNASLSKKEFNHLCDEIISESLFNDENSSYIDYSLLEVLNVFMLYAKKPVYIRNLIIAHNYTVLKWQNGSKFLHFYTLHNQNHAIRLINYCVDIIKSINYFQIDSTEWFILFMSCYLHDIAMTKVPNINLISSDKIFVDDLAFNTATKFLNLKKIDNNEKLKSSIEILKGVFKDIDYKLEEFLRNNHEHNSAEMVKNDKNLKLLIDSPSMVKNNISKVCVAHGHEAEVVYNQKVEECESINLKYLKIMLRLADLLDMDKTRVNPIFFDDNFNNMSETTKFHWYSHSIINSCNITSEYDFIETNELVETVCINIDLNFNINKATKCKDCKFNMTFKSITDKNNNPIGFEIPCDPDSLVPNQNINTENTCLISNSEKSSTFMCKWMCIKNNWLYNEIENLEQYLNRVKNPFTSKIRVRYYFSENSDIDYFAFIDNYIN